MPGMQLELFRFKQAVNERLTKLEEAGFGPRFFKHDPTLWKDDPTHAKVVANRMGWVDIPNAMACRMTQLSVLM